MVTDTIQFLIIFSLLLPLFSFFVLFLGAKFLPRKGDLVSVIFGGIQFFTSLYIFITNYQLSNNQSIVVKIPWFYIGKSHFDFSLLLNPVGASMLVVVSFIALLVQLYSVEYMKGKKNYERYFPYLNIFTFAMIGIVLSNNLLLTFMFWELVGFSSYLLIGFWYDKIDAIKASKKAFLFNRIGDIGFLIALLLTYYHFHTFDLIEIEAQFNASFAGKMLPIWLTIAGIGFFAACIGKSAQFPLQVWLPDAMEGPTPVSALIHAATMVAAGVYLMIKVYFLLSPEVRIWMVFTGAITSLIGAIPALFQYDIKKILAYSTISQLGYMVMGLGFDSYIPSFFHLTTHAFFKACLFLSAGVLIHHMQEIKNLASHDRVYLHFDPQDIRFMGGLAKKYKLTFFTFITSAAALVGIPFSTGALSKEMILDAATNWANIHSLQGNYLMWLIPLMAYSSLIITTVYVARMVYSVFFSDFRLPLIYIETKSITDHARDHISIMSIVVLILSVLSFCLIFSFNPLSAYNTWFVNYIDFDHQFPKESHLNLWPLLLIALGFLIAFMLKKNQDKQLRHFCQHGYNLSGTWVKSIRNDWKMDAFYYHFLVASGFRFSGFIASIDKKIIDPLVHLVAVMGVVGAHLSAWFDKFFIDGLVTLATQIIKFLSKIYKSIQNGQTQSYLYYTLLMMVFGMIYYLIYN
jgi:NADH-quinone oxidoreductase subunit L